LEAIFSFAENRNLPLKYGYYPIFFDIFGGITCGETCGNCE
jgi:hypothetical protein